jgi:hypothetical protein
LKSKSLRALVLHVDKVPVVSEFWEARAYIAVGFHMARADGLRVLSPNCVTPTEVAAWADELIKELESIKKEARRQ